MILNLVTRNLKLYFRDRASVFFSLLGVIIIVGLYVLFLGKMMVDYSTQLVGESARFLMTSWIVAGVVSVTAITTCNGAFGIMVEDTALNRLRDFKVSPIKRWQLVLGYVLAAMVVALLMTLFTLVLGELYIYLDGGEILGFLSLIKVLGIVLLSVFSSSAFIFLIMAFIKTQNAFGTASSIIGTLIGFLMGIYIPIGNLPTGVQTLIKLFPLSHSGVLLRKTMMNEAMDIELLPEEFKTFLGLTYKLNGEVMGDIYHLLYLFISGLVFYVLAIVIISKKRDK
jgi:multidrug/hemolysin transport system permease protein